MKNNLFECFTCQIFRLAIYQRVKIIQCLWLYDHKKKRSGLSRNVGILTQGKDSEGDLVFSIRDACIE